MSLSIGLVDGEATEVKNRDLVNRDDIVTLLRTHIKIEQHPVPDGTYGNLVCVSGISKASDALMRMIDHKFTLLKTGEE